MDSPNGTLWGLVKACENALIAVATWLEPIAWPFVWVIRLVLLAIASLFHKLAQLIVNATAAFMSLVLSHPDVVDAAANVMVTGMNKFLDQPDMSEKIKNASKHMSKEDKEEAALQIGRDLPLFVGGVIHGVFGGGGGDKNKNDDKTKVEEEKKSDDDDGDAGEEKTCDGNNDGGESKTNEDGEVVLYVNNGDGNGKLVKKSVVSQ